MKKLLIIAMFVLLGTAVKAQVVIIANKSVSAGSINKSKLADIYTLSIKNWDNGDKIVVFDLKNDGDVKDKFYGYLGKSNSDFKKIWMKAQLTGEGFAPEALGSDGEVLKRVSSTQGAIGYVSKGAANSSVKVLAEIN